MYWKRKLPHWVPEAAIIFITWRIAPSPTGANPRWLAGPRVARIVQDAVLYGAAQGKEPRRNNLPDINSVL
jgi:hypothetical protein